jgi:predicted DCC family thiol-disulfide oxidoreductase YuxK
MNELKILYDGKCHLCFKEIQHYLKKDQIGLLKGIDISDPKFDAAEFNLTEEQVNLELYSIDAEGNKYKAIDTFLEIWKRVPPYQYAIPIINQRLMRKGFDLAYFVFSRYIRPKLPKRKCGHGYCEV